MKPTRENQNQAMKKGKGRKEREIPKILFNLSSLPIAESDYLISQLNQPLNSSPGSATSMDSPRPTPTERD